MKFKFAIPTKVFFEKECVKNNSGILTAIGKKAVIVTGKHSAKACGALDDVTEVLDAAGIEYIIFNKIENNPSVETIEKAGKIAVENEVDFVIGIGGGSPLDASKAIAVLADNKDMGVLDLFKNDFTHALPIVCIPTTAGTGSEETPYSVLLRKDLQTKVSFGNEKTYPSYAFVDAKYTYSLGENSTISTAVDAFTHAFEGYLANRSSVISDCFALEAIRAFGKSMRNLAEFKLTEEDRENLMLVSLLGGIIISQTGVTIAHGMGYCYTYFNGIPHGKANGLIMDEYMKLNYKASEKTKKKIDTAIKELGCASMEEFAGILKKMTGEAPHLTEDEINQYTKLTLIQKGSMANNPYPIDENQIKELWTKLA